MEKFDLIIITGLPGTGKTTLARELARKYSLPLLSKDAIKEPLMAAQDCDPERSRALSDAAFAVMFSVTKEFLAAGVRLILEGNFRRGEHEAPLLAAFPERGVTILQVLCKIPEPLRRSRMAARALDPTRHPGHRDAQQLEPVPACDSFLELPGERMSACSDDAAGKSRASCLRPTK
jgi:predicted kinase